MVLDNVNLAYDTIAYMCIRADFAPGLGSMYGIQKQAVIAIDSIITWDSSIIWVPPVVDTTYALVNVVSTISTEDHYHYGHNGQMKTNEIAGVGNHYTALYWEYDPRVGRRWNLDPKPDPSISNYATFNNNPVFFSDVNGDKVRNGDRLAKEEYERKAKEIRDALDNFMKKFNIGEDMSKKEFLESGGDKATWKKYKGLNNRYEGLKNAAAHFEKQAIKTDKIIASWQKNSPNLFRAVDEAKSSVNGENVDFILFSSSFGNDPLGGDNILGKNGISYEGGANAPILRTDMNGLYIKNSMPIEVPEDIDVAQPRDTRHGLQYLLNHEAGHFLFTVRNTVVYVSFRNYQETNHIDNNGGHHKNDGSGKEAVELGNSIDIK